MDFVLDLLNQADSLGMKTGPVHYYKSTLLKCNLPTVRKHFDESNRCAHDKIRNISIIPQSPLMLSP